MDATAPDLIRAVIGFRQWRLHGDELWSLHADDRWERGLQTARCLGDHAHEGPAPQNGCTCGFYAWYAPTPRTASPARPSSSAAPSRCGARSSCTPTASAPSTR